VEHMKGAPLVYDMRGGAYLRVENVKGPLLGYDEARRIPKVEHLTGTLHEYIWLGAYS
jgi:hypothetical protein